MGNCIRSQPKTVQVVKPDGKILEYKPSTTVCEVLSEFPSHELSDKLPILQYMSPNVTLLAGRLYYLVPVPSLTRKIKNKKVRFAEPEKAEERKGQDSRLTVKLVIRKQELKEMLEHGGVSIDELVAKRHVAGGLENLDEYRCGRSTWIPAMQSISEVD
ncbi:unnamed protein product [Amaranthus hypochondriacus]